jgi:hypothetical protein
MPKPELSSSEVYSPENAPVKSSAYARPLELKTMIVRMSRAALVAAVIGAASISPVTTQARPLGTVEGMPFWGHPYPYGYVYHRPPEHCIQVQRLDPVFGSPVTEVTWICGDRPLSARY